MRKFHVFVGERYFVVHAFNAGIEYGQEHLVFDYMDEDNCIVECARFKTWDSYVEVFDGRDNSIDSEASESCA